ncbi:SDR family oxidoreductase [Rhodococcus sp. WS4]|nr:SDR family oxidoreductase [Rhodococcus sp. WS4]
MHAPRRRRIRRRCRRPCTRRGVRRGLTDAQHGSFAYHADLANRAALREFVDWMHSTYDGCDALINCAGINVYLPDGEQPPVDELEDHDWDRTLAINLTAPFLLTRGFLPRMKARGWGRIVNIASRAAHMYYPGANSAYGASKAGLLGLTRFTAGEAANSGVTSNTVAPGRISTPLANKATPKVVQSAVNSIPLGRVGEVEEIAAAVGFLASEQSSYINGAVIDVNGGAYMP